MRGYLSEGREQLHRALTARPLVGDVFGSGASAMGDGKGAVTLTPEQKALSLALSAEGILATEQGDFAAARAAHEECLILYRTVGNSDGVAKALNNLGNIAYKQGDYAAARSLY